MSDAFNSIVLVILKYIYSLTGKAPFAKRIYDLYFFTAPVFFFSFYFELHVFFATYCNALDTRVRILFPAMAIYMSIVITF